MSHRAVLLVGLTLTFCVCVCAQQTIDPAINAANSRQLPAAINGTVLTIDNRPVADARVELRDLDKGTTVGNTFTHANGAFELYNIVPGQYEVVAFSGLNEARDRVHLITGDATVTLRINAPVSGGPSGGATVSVSQFKVPEKARKEYDRAYKAFSEGKFDEAKEKIGKALGIYENFAEALTLRGILAVNDGNHEGGEADLQKAIQCDSRYAMAYFAMGAAMNQSGNYQQAITSLERGVVLAPEAWQGRFEMAKALLGKGDFAAALTNAVKAQELVKGQYPPIYLVKAHALLGLKQFDTAIVELENFLSREPQGVNSANARQTLDRAKAFVANNPERAFKPGGSR